MRRADFKWILIFLGVVAGVGLAVKGHSLLTKDAIFQKESEKTMDSILPVSQSGNEEQLPVFMQSESIFVGKGMSTDQSIAQSKAKMDAYMKISQYFSGKSDSIDLILRNTRIIQYKVHRRGKQYVYECYVKVSKEGETP